MMYGKELILDIHYCTFVKVVRSDIKRFMKILVKEIDMEAEDLFFWDYLGQMDEYKKAPKHLKGTSAVQFIKTSNITIHTLDEMKRVYLNIFSCKDFEVKKVKEVCLRFWGGQIVNERTVIRK